MAEAIDELLVRLGLETDSKSFKEANNQFAGVRTAALALGTAIVGAGVGLAKISDGVARSVDTLGKWSDAAGVSIRRAQQLKFALGQAGSANAESDMMSMFENVESLRTQAQRGELSQWAMIESGMNLHSLMGMSNEEGLDFLMRELSAMSDPDRQRRALSELGFSGPAQHGVMTNYEATQQAYQRSDELGNADEDLFKKAEAYTNAMGELSKAMDGFRLMVANQLLPGMTTWTQALTDWVASNRGGASEAARILSGDGTAYEKAKELAGSEEVRGTVGAAGSAYGGLIDSATGWHPANILIHKISDYLKYEPPSESQTSSGRLIRDADGKVIRSTTGDDIVVPPRAPEPVHGQPRPTPPRVNAIPGTGLSPEELNYSPSSSQIIPHGNQSDLIEGNRRLLPSYVPSLSRPAASSSTTMNINVDARGSTDPMLTSERVRGVIRDEVGRMVDVSRDGIPTNVA